MAYLKICKITQILGEKKFFLNNCKILNFRFATFTIIKKEFFFTENLGDFKN